MELSTRAVRLSFSAQTKEEENPLAEPQTEHERGHKAEENPFSNPQERSLKLAGLDHGVAVNPC